MTPERRREIAALGGKAVRPENRNFSRDRVSASKAGAKGGANQAAENRTFSKNRELAMKAGRKGGAARHKGGTNAAN